MHARRIVLTLVALALAACKSSSQSAGSAEQAEERMNLLTNPAVYVSAIDAQYEEGDEDAAAALRHLKYVAVFNNSRFTVRDLGGDVVWLDEQGKRLGSAPFSLTGAIEPGNWQGFSTDEGTLKIAGKQSPGAVVHLVFTKVKVD
jgi:hypothetical protein